MAKLGDAYVEISADNKRLNRDLNTAKENVVSWTTSVRGFMERIGQRLFDGITNGLRSVVSTMGSAVNASSDLNETISKTAAVFGSAAQGVYEWSKTSASAMGLSQRAALDVVSGLGNMFIQLGANKDQAVSLSQEMVVLSADIASFNNVAGGSEEVLVAMRSAFIGEFDALQRYIPTISAATVQQRALAMTGKENIESLTMLDKALAVQEIIITGAGAAVGDFARTSRDLANSQRIAAAELEGFSARMGNAFRPVLTSVLNQLIEIGRQVEPYAEQIMANIARGLASAIRYIAPALMTLRNLFVYWLQPGSPPRLLPELIEWGRAAAGEFVGGFAKADFSALDTLGKSIEGILRSFVGTKDIADTDIVSRVLGTREAITAAIAEFKRVGSVSQNTLNEIIRLGGPAGKSVGNMVEAYFRLRTASEATARAQEQLNDVTDRYDKILNPLRGSLDDVRKAQQDLRDQQRLVELQNTINNFDATAAEKEAARLEIQQMALQDQIDLEEEKRDSAIETAQTAVDGAKEQETAAQDQFDVAQAVLNQQVETNNLVAEEIRLQEQLAEARKQAAEAALREAEAAAKEQQQLAEEARREQEELNNAILDYQMQLADTPGKIALMRGELAKTAVGSVEYYNILTQIASLEDQLAREREAAAKKSGAGGLGVLAEAPPMEESSFVPELDGITAAADELKKALDEVFGQLKTVTPEDVARIKAVGDSATELLGTFLEFARAVGLVKDSTNTDVDSMANATKLGYDSMASTVRVFTALVKGDFATFWKELKANWKMGFTDVNTDTVSWTSTIQTTLGSFALAMQTAWSGIWTAFTTAIGTFVTNTLTSWGNFFTGAGGLAPTVASFAIATAAAWGEIWTALTTAISTFVTNTKTAWGNFLSGPDSLLSKVTGLGTSMYNAGSELVDQLWKGLKAKWADLSSWWSGPTGVWTEFRNLLPFSEPKDPSSPLRGLGKSGESMINIIHEGMKRAAGGLNNEVGTLATPAMAMVSQPSLTGPTNQVGGITIHQVFQGATDEKMVREATRFGILDALRAAGVSA